MEGKGSGKTWRWGKECQSVPNFAWRHFWRTNVWKWKLLQYCDQHIVFMTKIFLCCKDLLQTYIFTDDSQFYIFGSERKKNIFITVNWNKNATCLRKRKSILHYFYHHKKTFTAKIFSSQSVWLNNISKLLTSCSYAFKFNL